MSSLRPVGRSAATLESQARSAGKLARELSYFFPVSSVPPLCSLC